MNGQYGNYGAGYLPTGAASSPGLYNMALYNERWLPSWASLKGGIMGPLYTPQIRDPATVAAIMGGSWDFPMVGSMFDPQGNYDRDPLPNHFYSGRSMTLHGYGGGGGFGGPLDIVRGFFDGWMAWVSSLSPFWKLVYWAGVAFVGIKALQMTSWGRKLIWTTGIHKLPVVGAVVRKNRGHRRAKKARGGRRSKRRHNTGDWWTAAQRKLERMAAKEAARQKAAHVRRGRKASTFRYSPPEWHRDAVAALGRNDEAGFKSIMLYDYDAQRAH